MSRAVGDDSLREAGTDAWERLDLLLAGGVEIEPAEYISRCAVPRRCGALTAP
jgi:hypothetical protein